MNYRKLFPPNHSVHLYILFSFFSIRFISLVTFGYPFFRKKPSLWTFIFVLVKRICKLFVRMTNVFNLKMPCSIFTTGLYSIFFPLCLYTELGRNASFGRFLHFKWANESEAKKKGQHAFRTSEPNHSRYVSKPYGKRINFFFFRFNGTTCLSCFILCLLLLACCLILAAVFQSASFV